MGRRALGALLLGVLLAAPWPAGQEAFARRAPQPALDDAAADRLAATAPGQARDRALAAWGEHAPLPALMFVLRRPAAELGGAEVPLLEAALARSDPARVALRARLATRLALADPARGKRRVAELPGHPGELPLHPRASVFRVAALLPDSGDYRAYGRTVYLGISAALAEPGAASDRPLELRAWSTGDADPARMGAALDSALDRSGVLIGELLSVPTLAIGTAARIARVPLVSPTATDEGVGAVSGSAFQIGPSSARRGIELARSWLDEGPLRVGVLESADAARGSFGRRFASAAEAFGFPVVWRETYAPDNQDFRLLVRALVAKKVELLFWDGEPREADALLKQLAKDAVSVRLCGGEPLAPEQHHAQARPLLEGVRYIAEDWRLADSQQARLDSLARAAGEERAGSLFVRGYLAGRFVASAIAGGAMCPEEVASFLASWAEKDPAVAARGFLNCPAEGATLPVFSVERGKGVRRP
jgi:ABC-type branched-subunit amino acid transport system substrate-binding protein